MVRCRISDLFGELTQRTVSAEGFLIAPANMSTAGNVQAYTARELGLTGDGMAPTRVVKLYRPKDEVAAPDAIKSFEGATLTLDHPPDAVTADSWPDVSVGEVRDVKMSGDHMSGIITIRDAAAIKAVQEDSKRQMSCGYDFDLDLTPGLSPSGAAYDGVMRNIRGNHLAIVDAARGGPGCRIADRKNKETEMATVRRMIDSLTVEIADEQSASIVDRALATSATALKTAQDAAISAEKRATDAEKAKVTLEKEKADLVTAHDAKVKELEAKILKPEALAALVAEHSALVGDAKVLAPELMLDTTKPLRDLRAAVVGDVLAKDEALKATVEGMLKAAGEPDVAKASDGTLKLVIAAIAPAKRGAAEDGAARSSASDQADRDKALAGDGSGKAPKAQKLVGRDLMARVDYLRSRGQKKEAEELLKGAN